MYVRPAQVRPVWWLLAAFVVTLAAKPGAAQNDRRLRQDPALVVESGGRLGVCDQLQFTPGGDYLLAGGDDKVVRTWRCSKGKLHDGGVLRWSIWREQRGAIYALAISPDRTDTRIAVGGMGVQSSAIAVLDRLRGSVLKTVVPGLDTRENFYGVMALAFDRQGRRLAFGTAEGTVWLWDLKTYRRLGKQAGTGTFNHVRLVRFLDDNHLLSVAENGEVRRWDVSQDPAEAATLPSVQVEKYSVFRAELSPDGNWLAAALKGPVVAVRSLDGKRQNDIELNEGEFPRSLAFDPRTGKLAVGIGHLLKGTGFYLEGNDQIRIYDLSHSPPLAVDGPPHSWRADALAFHPTDARLAVAGGENHEVTLWDLDKLKKPVSVMRGVGSGLWEVGLSKDGRAVGFRETRDHESLDPNHRGKGVWRAFDLFTREWLEPNEFKPVSNLSEAGGWHIEPSRESPFVWNAVKNDGTKHAVPLDDKRDGMPRCWTFLPEKNGKPTRLAVGHYWGLSIFTVTDEKVERTRLCVGHQGEVMALGVAQGGTWLVSASTDQTVAAWSLAGDDQAQLGGRFAERDGRLFVDSVTPGGAIWEAGLVSGDEVVKFAFNGKEVTGGPDAWQERLRQPVPGKQHYFDVRRGGKQVEVATNCNQRPLWRFFPTKDGEWVLWMWRNSYYDTSTKGDFYIGWHVNTADMKGTPSFYRGEQFRKHFHRPAIIDKLLECRDPQVVLNAAGNPLPWRFDENEPPAVALELAPAGPGNDVSATLKVTPHGDSPDFEPVHAELWLNDFRMNEWTDFAGWKKDGKTLVLSWTIPNNRLRTGRNVVTFQTYNRLGGRSDDVKALSVERPEGRPNLIGLSVGIDDYKDSRKSSGGRGQLTNLNSARHDAEAMNDAWSGQSLYQAARMRPLFDAQAGRTQLLAALDDVAKKARPDDRFVLFLAGHGTFVKHKAGETFIFCCPQFDPDQPETTGLTSEELYAKLAAIPCRKLVLFDACHSGMAADPARLLTPGGQGPTVIAACDRSQQSWEDPDLRHGLFTFAVLEALGRGFTTADANGDGQLDANELFLYTRKRMPQLLQQIKRKPHQQVPTLYAPLDADNAPLAVRK
jgi:WD40 repeat protein